MEIQHSIENFRGEFKAIEHDRLVVGTMTYTRTGDNKISIDHTEVSPVYEGKGIGHSLVKEAVRYAREQHLKIKPMCWFVKLVLTRNPEFKDILA
jgi:predicted GNAT family acetyltransferase